MLNLNEIYFSISERCGRNHQNKFCLRPLKRRFYPWELNDFKLKKIIKIMILLPIFLNCHPHEVNDIAMSPTSLSPTLALIVMSRIRMVQLVVSTYQRCFDKLIAKRSITAESDAMNQN